MAINKSGGSGLETLRYRAENTIMTPHTVELRGDMLTWRIPDRRKRGCFVPVPIRGCLRAAARLSNATPERVLAFVQHHGVLALDPMVQSEYEEGSSYLRYTESVWVYTRLGAIARRLLAVIDHLLYGVALTKVSRCSRPDLTGVSEYMQDEFEALYHLLYVEGYNPEYMRSDITRIVQELWDASPPMLAAKSDNDISLPGLWVQFVNNTGIRHWDWTRTQCYRSPQHLRISRPGSWFSVSADRGETHRADSREEMMSYRDYANAFVQLLPFMEETRPSSLLSVLAFQLMEAITLPEDTYYCKQCQAEFRPTPGRNAPRADHGGCCSDECSVLWKRAYNKRLYQQRKNDGQTTEMMSSRTNVSDQAPS